MLISNEEWSSLIQSLDPGTSNLETNPSRAARMVAESLKTAISTDQKKVGVLLSGGVDSTTVAHVLKSKGVEVQACSVGIEGAHDLEWSKRASEVHGLEWYHKVLSLEEVEHITKKVIALLKTTDMISIGVGMVTYAGCAMASKLNCTQLWSGLGSEELFAGYKRHVDALSLGPDAVHQECVRGLKEMRNRDLVRDFSIAQHFNLQLMMPFLDKDLIKTALGVHPLLKASTEEQKIVLREASKVLGVAEEFTKRKKSAAQYGSGVLKALDKLAAQNGCENKKAYVEKLANM